jgi:hypothetical protein
MKKKENKKVSPKTSKPVDLVAEAMSRMGDKPLFPEKVEDARKHVRSIRNAKFEGL